MEERNAQYTRICQTIFARQAVSCSCIQMSADVDEPYCKLRVGSNFVEKTDVVIWLGDLNYRVELPRSSVGFLISHNLEKVKLSLNHYDLKRFLFTATKNIQYASHWGFPMGECYVAGVVGKGPTF